MSSETERKHGLVIIERSEFASDEEYRKAISEYTGIPVDSGPREKPGFPMITRDDMPA